MISTKGRYALRIMIDLAEHRNGGFIPMKEVAARQEISLKYIERIMPVLTKNNLVKGLHGKGGGYQLTREPDEYTVLEVLQAAEGDLAPVACLEQNAEPCPRAYECRTLPMWKDYYDTTRSFFEDRTIADLMAASPVDNYVI